MKRRIRNENRREVMLVGCVVVLAMAISLAQNTPPNPAQETLDFINSPQGTGVVNKVQMLMKVSYAKVVFSNELVHASANTTLSPPVRQFALDALQTYDKSATNTYQEIEMYIATWPFLPDTEPAMTTDTILTLKRGIELGSSAFVQLQSVLSDTNIPALYREKMGQLASNLLYEATSY